MPRKQRPQLPGIVGTVASKPRSAQYERKTKDCRGCGRRLDKNKFGANNKYKDGLQPRCKDCLRAEQRVRRNADKIQWANVGMYPTESMQIAVESRGVQSILQPVGDPRLQGIVKFPPAPVGDHERRMRIPRSWPPTPYIDYPVNTPQTTRSTDLYGLSPDEIDVDVEVE